MSKKLFNVTEDTTMREVQKFFDYFVVTGITTDRKRFRKTYDKLNINYAFGVNLFRGNVWGVKNQKRQRLKSVWN